MEGKLNSDNICAADTLIVGPIFSLNFVGTPVLVVGNAKMAADLMVLFVQHGAFSAF